MWRSVVVDGEAFFWKTYTGHEELQDGTRVPSEFVVVARQPYSEGVHLDGVSSRRFPGGTAIAESDAIATIRWLRERGSKIL